MPDPIKTPATAKLLSYDSGATLVDVSGYEWVTMHGDQGRLVVKQIAAALNAVAKLPKTADGVAAFPGMKVYHTHKGWLSPKDAFVRYVDHPGLRGSAPPSVPQKFCWFSSVEEAVTDANPEAAKNGREGAPEALHHVSRAQPAGEEKIK